MTKPEVIVDTVHNLSPSGEIGEEKVLETKPSPFLVAVKLHGGRTAHLDMSMPNAKTWAGILGVMQRARHAVYLRIDPITGLITDLLIPRAVKVATLKTGSRKADVEVELVVSEMRHYLRLANPDFDHLLKALDEARKTETPVLVTDSRDRREIIDVRPIPETVAVPAYLSTPLTKLLPPEALRTVPKKKRSRSGKGGAK